jgi:hypothetical protein
MKPFPYDEFYPVFMEEVKSIFSRFISLNKDKKPYIFVIAVPDYVANSYSKPFSCCLSARGNTIADFESTRYSYDNPKGSGLVFKYNSEEWSAEAWRNNSFSNNDFSKANQIIFNYIIENEDMIEDKDYQFTEGFKAFRSDFFSFLIKCLKQLRDEKFFDSVYPERVLVNFEVREYYEDEEIIRTFESLNTKEETELFAEWILPNWGQLTKRENSTLSRKPLHCKH